MSSWEHIGEAIAFALYSFCVLMMQRRQQNSLERKLPEIIGTSLRPGPAPLTPQCEHPAIGLMLADRLAWCTQCGAIKVDGRPWRRAGEGEDDVTPTTLGVRCGNCGHSNQDHSYMGDPTKPSRCLMTGCTCKAFRVFREG